ncbi:hypothetical protein [Flammeovirga sp. SJP92]|uniref:hypothetical protein n=1 Tax=Flammeovirga sp. SJP92 TaxID=1775430 RepID=UPI00079CCD9E|nr:hypothetical protein [Flammeovirga sp. SJP92]KXX66911.1 hypothetical protein AVL50_29845 [Flammeovirga sp. SJP92]
MKKGILFYILIHVTLFALCQNKKEIITSIRQKYKEINAYEKYDVITLSNDDFIEENIALTGELKCYSKEGSIQKIVEKFYPSYGAVTIEYYYDDQECLLFVYREVHVFNHILHIADTVPYVEPDARDLKLISERRLYFYENELIELKKKGRDQFILHETDEELLEFVYHHSEFNQKKIKEQ